MIRLLLARLACKNEPVPIPPLRRKPFPMAQGISMKYILVNMEIVLDNKESRHKGAIAMEKSEQNDLLHSGKQDEEFFLFVGDALALDAINTERLIKGTRCDLLSSPDTLAHWWHLAQLHDPTLEPEQRDQEGLLVDPGVLEAFKGLRMALRHLFAEVVAEHEIHEEDLAPLNDVLKMGSQVLEQTEPGIFRLRDHPGPQPEARILLPIVRSAIWLLTEGTRSRLRSCHNPRCRLFFYDRTRSATRQWCCLKCMDRARSARRYAQVKEQRPGV
jgi:predicted RNA-binding Zn ribbon-like protein